MAATEDDIAEQIRRETGGQRPGQEPRRRGWWGPSNAFARLYGPNLLDQLFNTRYQLRSSAAGSRTNYAAAQYFRGLRSGAAPKKSESFRGRGRTYRRVRPGDAQLLVRPQDAFAKKEKEAAATRAFRQRQFTARLSARNVAGRDIATNPWLLVAAESYFAGLAEQRERRAGILGVGRRGAAATRPLSTTGTGRPSRTGAGSTRPLAVPAPRVQPGTIPGAAPGSVPARSVPNESPLSAPSRSPARSPTPSGAPARAPQPVQIPGALPGWIPSTLQLPKLSLANMFATVFPQLLPARVPRIAPSFVARPVPATTTQPRLTPLNAPLVGFSQATSLGPVPKEELAKCKCPPKRKSTKPRCRNPVISRTRAGDIQTTKVRLVCPPSKLK